MRANKITEVKGDYAGSGDSGGMDNIVAVRERDQVPIPDDITDLIENWVYSRCDPNFDDDGSSGSFLIEWETKQMLKLLLNIDHVEYYTDHNSYSFDDEL